MAPPKVQPSTNHNYSVIIDTTLNNFTGGSNPAGEVKIVARDLNRSFPDSKLLKIAGTSNAEIREMLGEVIREDPNASVDAVYVMS